MESVKVGIRTAADQHIIPLVYKKWTELLCEGLKLNCQFINFDLPIGDFHNGSATGFMETLISGLINTTIPYFVPTMERSQYLHNPTFTFDSEDVFITRKATNNDIKWLSVFLPFSLTVWLVLCAALSLVTLVLNFSVRKSSNSDDLWGLITTLINLFAYLARKGPKMIVRNTSGKLLLTVWGFSAVLIVVMYSSFLMPTLLHKPVNVPFNNIPELTKCIEQQRCKYISVPNWFMIELEAADASRQLTALKNAINQQPTVQLSWFESLQLALSPTDIFYVTGPESRLVIDNNHTEHCDKLEIIPSPVTVRTSFLFRKADNLANKFELKAEQLDSFGLFEAIRRKFPRHLKCENLQIPDRRLKKVMAFPLPLKAMASCFIVVIFGGSLGLIGLLLEVISSFCEENRGKEYFEARVRSSKLSKKVKLSLRPSVKLTNNWTRKLQKQLRKSHQN